MWLCSVRRRGNSIGIGSGGDPGRLLAAEDFDKVVSLADMSADMLSRKIRKSTITRNLCFLFYYTG